MKYQTSTSILCYNLLQRVYLQALGFYQRPHQIAKIRNSLNFQIKICINWSQKICLDTINRPWTNASLNFVLKGIEFVWNIINRKIKTSSSEHLKPEFIMLIKLSSTLDRFLNYCEARLKVAQNFFLASGSESSKGDCLIKKDNSGSI